MLSHLALKAAEIAISRQLEVIVDIAINCRGTHSGAETPNHSSLGTREDLNTTLTSSDALVGVGESASKCESRCELGLGQTSLQYTIRLIVYKLRGDE